MIARFTKWLTNKLQSETGFDVLKWVLAEIEEIER